MLTMFCLVSRQAMANVLPVLMYGPKNVFLLATPEEKSCANNLEKLFLSKNIEVQRKDGLDAYDYIGFKNFVKEQLELQNNDTWLNVTGGTKLMAFAAYEAFAEKDKKIIYCNTEKNQIIQLFPNLDTQELKLSLSLIDYLSSYGYNIVATRTENINNEYFKLFDLLESKNLIKKFSDFLENYRSKTGSRDPLKTYIDRKENIFSIQKTPLSILLFIYKEKFEFDDERFLKGDWLEYYMLYSLKKQGIDPEVGVKIISENQVENEIDLMFIKNYQLFLISCKSGRNTDPNRDMYEIEALRNVAGGTFGNAFLFTAEDLTDRMRQRAKDLKIKTLSLNNLTHTEFI